MGIWRTGRVVVLGKRWGRFTFCHLPACLPACLAFHISVEKPVMPSSLIKAGFGFYAESRVWFIWGLGAELQLNFERWKCAEHMKQKSLVLQLRGIPWQSGFPQALSSVPHPLSWRATFKAFRLPQRQAESPWHAEAISWHPSDLHTILLLGSHPADSPSVLISWYYLWNF